MQSPHDYLQSCGNDLKDLNDSVLRLQRQIDKMQSDENHSQEHVLKLNMIDSMIHELKREMRIVEVIREDIFCSIKGPHLRTGMR